MNSLNLVSHKSNAVRWEELTQDYKKLAIDRNTISIENRNLRKSLASDSHIKKIVQLKKLLIEQEEEIARLWSMIKRRKAWKQFEK